MIGLLMLLATLAVVVGMFGLWVYGIVLCFQKKWYVGLAALSVPLFAQVIAVGKLCGKDLLK